MAIIANNATNLFLASLREIWTVGDFVEVKKIPTKELLNFEGIIENPRHRWILVPERRMNTFSSCLETLWVLSGSDKVDILSKILPRAKMFSDDGKTWRAAYGKRLLNFGSSGVNQLDYCLNSLVKEITSRQSVACIWDADKEAVIESSKDYPCSNWLQFIIRKNQLFAFLQMRSNDLIWGASAINWIEFTVIQELMCYFLNKRGIQVKLGPYVHRATSFHIYLDNRIKWDIPSTFEKYPEGIPFEKVSYLDNLQSPESPNDFDELSTDMENILNIWADEKTRLDDLSPSFINSFPIVIQDMIYAIFAYKDEKPQESPILKRLRDLNLVKSLSLSWLPANHMDYFRYDPSKKETL